MRLHGRWARGLRFHHLVMKASSLIWGDDVSWTSLRGLFQKTLASSAAKVFWDLLARSLNFALFLFIARSLGVAGYGRYAVLWYLAWMAAQLTDLGLHLVVLRNLSRKSSRWSLVDAVAAKGALTLLSLVGAGAIAVLGTQSPSELASLLLLYLAALFGSWAELFGVALRSRGKLALEGAVLLVLRAGWLVGALVALRPGGGIGELSLSLAAASGPALLLAALLAGRHVGAGLGRTSTAVAGTLLRQAAPVAITSVITLVYLRLDVLLLAHLQGDVEAGVFAASFRLLEALFLFSGGIVAGAFPWIASRVGRQGLKELSEFVLRMLLWVALPAATGLVLLAEPIVELLYGAGYAGSAAPLRLLAAAVIPIYINALTTHLLVATGRGSILVSLMLVRLTVGLVLDLAFIPSWGAVGAAMAVVGAEWSLAVASLIANRRLLSTTALARVTLAPSSGVRFPARTAFVDKGVAN